MENQSVSSPTPTVSDSIPTATTPQTHSKKTMLIILGILEIPFPAIALYILLPLLKLQDTLGTNFIAPFIGFGFFIIALLIALAQLVAGIFSFDLKLGQQKTKGLIIVGLILGVLTIPAMILFVIMPIYSNLQTLK